MLILISIVIYVYSTLACTMIIGKKNDWDPEVFLVAFAIGLLPIVNSIYTIMNLKYIDIKL